MVDHPCQDEWHWPGHVGFQVQVGALFILHVLGGLAWGRVCFVEAGLFSRSYIVLRKYETADIGFSFTSPRP